MSAVDFDEVRRAVRSVFDAMEADIAREAEVGNERTE